MNLQSSLAIVKESQLPESVHEKTYSGPGSAYHLGERFLAEITVSGTPSLPK
jgi:hypothetical protein